MVSSQSSPIGLSFTFNRVHTHQDMVIRVLGWKTKDPTKNHKLDSFQSHEQTRGKAEKQEKEIWSRAISVHIGENNLICRCWCGMHTCTSKNQM